MHAVERAILEETRPLNSVPNTNFKFKGIDYMSRSVWIARLKDEGFVAPLGEISLSETGLIVKRAEVLNELLQWQPRTRQDQSDIKYYKTQVATPGVKIKEEEIELLGVERGLFSTRGSGDLVTDSHLGTRILYSRGGVLKSLIVDDGNMPVEAREQVTGWLGGELGGFRAVLTKLYLPDLRGWRGFYGLIDEKNTFVPVRADQGNLYDQKTVSQGWFAPDHLETTLPRKR